MRRGTWHQFGDRSQKLALEQLEAGTGEGVIISPRDLSEANALTYAPQYRSAGGDVLWDSQFYIPDATLGKLDGWSIATHRDRVSGLNRISPVDLNRLSSELERQNAALGTSAVVAPAVVYEAAQPDVADLNATLFAAAKRAGAALGRPTYATVVIGNSATAADAATESILSAATALDADGWYFAFEFRGDQRLPNDRQTVYRACRAALRLAATGRPVLHAFAGPLGILSPGCGATGVGVGHSQNLWQFTRDRWQPGTAGGGGGDAPARHFSDALWGTIVDPDESARLPPPVLARVMTSSPYRHPWNRWQAGKHHVCVVCDRVQRLLDLNDPAAAADAAVAHLASAVSLHAEVRHTIPKVKDDADSYQEAWRSALAGLRHDRRDDYDYLAMLA